MKSPEDEQRVLEGFIRVPVLVVDDVGAGSETAYARQALQEILDGRDFEDRGGLVVTSQFSLNALSGRLNDRSIPSRLAGMCRVIEIRGPDHRQDGRARRDIR
jgi:DNA replication protein DnaC